MRFHVPSESIFLDKNTIEIKDKSELHHIRDVMRLKKGAKVAVFNGEGGNYSGVVRKIDRVSALIDIEKKIDFKDKFFLNVNLYQAIPKKSKMDSIIEKATELGVNRIIPIISERTIPSFDRISESKIGRWERIVKSASKQCGRTRLPLISKTTSFDNALVESKKSDLVVFATLEKSAKPLKEVLKNFKPKSISVFVGPEGDFDEKEILMAKKENFSICSLGSLVLRVETAAIYILSCLNYEYR